MRVVAVSTWFPTAVAPGSGAFVAKDLLALAERHDVDLIHLVPPHQDDGTRHIRHGRVRVQRVPMATSRPNHIWRAGGRLRRLLDGADVVHTMAFSTLLPFAWWRPRVPWVHTEHWSGLTTPKILPASWRLALPALRTLQQRPDVTTAVCSFLGERIRADRHGPVTVVPCIVPPLDQVPARTRRDGDLRLVSVGGLVERKDPVLAVRTLAELRKRGVRAHLTWVGGGPLETAVREEARARGLAGQVHLTGNRDASGVSEALAEADLFFLPTRAENFCVSAAEALVHGRPVVVGATGGQGEYIDRRVGALVATQEPSAYADAIMAVDAATRDLPATEIAATVGDRFSPHRVASGYETAYEEAGMVFRTRRA